MNYADLRELATILQFSPNYPLILAPPKVMDFSLSIISFKIQLLHDF